MTKIKIISGGQEGADIGALTGAKEVGLLTGGTAPPGWISGGKNRKPLLVGFGLVEGESDPKIYPKRTMKNVDNSDGTVAILWGSSIGTNKTIGYCQHHKWCWPSKSIEYYKPYLIIETRNLHAASLKLKIFIKEYGIKTLNVAGNRETSQPGIFEFTKLLVMSLNSYINSNELI